MSSRALTGRRSGRLPGGRGPAAPAAATLSALPSAPAQAPAPADPAPAAAAAGWLASRLDGGLIVGQFGPSYGASIDAGRSLQAVSGHADDVAAVTAAVTSGIGSYISGEAFGDAGSTYAGATAKAAAYASAVQADPRAFGGVDLIARLEAQVDPSGRIFDTSTYGDFANGFGQAFALEGLSAVNSAKEEVVQAYLLAQQCDAGYFTESLPARDAATATCDATGGKPSLDATSLALKALLPEATDAGVLKALVDGATWLVGQQAADGSFGAGSAQGANANSTALAADVLGTLSQASPTASSLLAPARRAATWLRAHQLATGACAPVAAKDLGAVAYNDADRTSALAAGITDETATTFDNVAVQVVRGLLWAPVDPGPTNVLFTAEYVRAGRTQQVGVTGATPGAPVCARLGNQRVVRWADVEGEALLPVSVPARTGKSTVVVTDAAGRVDTATINALGAAKLKVRVPATAAAGDRLVVRVTGLAPGEKVRAILGKQKRPAQANGAGKATVRLTVGPKRGTKTLRAVGEFANRKGAASFRVTR
ncbi:hypothetical protein [Nocardioides sp. R-C-SC26]|uniref:hypothetical protein n=1 Tax=Nocardioides sp. R-C-SC26 TaxID=2870414 RepID=UPI001E389CA1|nr:hypothetical protein [Nocardioides sp. R-C-SC26]